MVCHHVRPSHPAELHFIVAAEKAQACVMADARQIVLQLRTDVLFKRRIHPVYITGKHRILPDNQAKAVAGIIEPVVGIVAAAPYANRVEVGGGAILQQALRLLGRHSRDHAILGHIVRAHGKYLDSIDPETEFLAPFVLVAAHRQLSQADLLMPSILHLAVFVLQFHIQGI